MPKATLVFKLPEEKDEYQWATEGFKYLRTIEDLDDYLRRKLKYEELTEEQDRIYQEIRSKLWELRNEED
jgi:hypothetical protein